MKMIKLAMLGATALAFASLAPVMAADGGCANFKTELAGTTATLLAPTPVASFELPVDMLMPNETTTAFYTGDNAVPKVKKLEGNAGIMAWKPEEALVDDASDSGPKTSVLAQADLGMIKADGSVVVDGKKLGMKLTF